VLGIVLVLYRACELRSRKRSSTRYGRVTGKCLIPISLLPGLGEPDRMGARTELGEAGREARLRRLVTSARR